MVTSGNHQEEGGEVVEEVDEGVRVAVHDTMAEVFLTKCGMLWVRL